MRQSGHTGYAGVRAVGTHPIPMLESVADTQVTGIQVPAPDYRQGNRRAIELVLGQRKTDPARPDDRG